MKNFEILFLISLTTLLQLSTCEVIPSEICKGEEQNSISQVLEVRISPCLEPVNETNKVCVVKKGTTAAISVDFVPDEAVDSLRAGLYYVGALELPFLGLETKGCKSLTKGSCPLEPQENYTWTENVKLSRAFPASRYPLKIRLTDAEDKKRIVACRTFDIELIS